MIVFLVPDVRTTSANANQALARTKVISMSRALRCHVRSAPRRYRNKRRWFMYSRIILSLV